MPGQRMTPARGSFLVATIAMMVIASACTPKQPAPAPHVSTSGAASATDLLSEVRKRGTVVISSDPNYQPMSYRTSDGVWHGFDVEVGREIARRLGVKARFMAVNFDAITGGNWDGRWDLNVNSMTITHDRQRVLFFTEPYYYDPAAFFVYKTSPVRSIDDLAGKRVGVGTATTYQAYLEGHLTLTGENILIPAPAARAVPYDTDQLALGDLAAGDGVHLDAVLTSWPFAEYQMRKGMPIRMLGQPVFFEDAAAAVDKNSPLDPTSFYAAVNSAIQAMHADGTLSRLSKRELDIDFSHK
jgi:polar amino acid transport system substrate-binding protein